MIRCYQFMEQKLIFINTQEKATMVASSVLANDGFEKSTHCHTMLWLALSQRKVLRKKINRMKFILGFRHLNTLQLKRFLKGYTLISMESDNNNPFY